MRLNLFQMKTWVGLGVVLSLSACMVMDEPVSEEPGESDYYYTPDSRVEESSDGEPVTAVMEEVSHSDGDVADGYDTGSSDKDTKKDAVSSTEEASALSVDGLEVEVELKDDNSDAGRLTASEWNDLEDWDFWKSFIEGSTGSNMPSYWKMFLNNRISLQVTAGQESAVDLPVKLFKGQEVVWKSRTDNNGLAEMWIGFTQSTVVQGLEDYRLTVDGQEVDQELVLYDQGVNQIQIGGSSSTPNQVDISFIVDATGSMADEIRFLQQDLQNVIERVQNHDAQLEISTSSVFYRDVGDQYLTKKSDFTNHLNQTIQFIQDQSANGGGDFPEAVHSALEVAIDDLNWSESARTRIAFLLLDAPPHNRDYVKESLQESIFQAAKRGIKVIPISASGVDKPTEFLMRFLSIATNGTYVYITDDSGIGNSHLEASVGETDVEMLNDLMVRLIEKYSE